MKAYLRFLWTDDLPSEYLNQLNYYISSPRALFFSKISSILNLVFVNHYYLIGVFVSILSFGGFYYLADILSNSFPKSKNAAVVAFLFAPSVVLWSSGLIKESIATSSLALIIGTVIANQKLGKGLKVKQWILLIISFYFAWKLKYYYVGVLVPTLIASWLLYSVSKKLQSAFFHKYRVFTWVLALAVGIMIISTTQINLQFNYLPEVIKINHDAFVAKSQEGDYIVFNHLDSNWGSILANSPKAVWSGLFRPFFWDINTGFKLISSIENLVLLVLLLWNLPSLRWGMNSEDNLWLTAGIIYILALAVFLSLSTPNLGTLTRYKAGFSFLFTYLILFEHPIFAIISTRIQKWKNR